MSVMSHKRIVSDSEPISQEPDEATSGASSLRILAMIIARDLSAKRGAQSKKGDKEMDTPEEAMDNQ